MSKKCVIEKYLYKSALLVNFVEVKKEDFFMIADLALKQLAISKAETTGVVSDGFSYDAKPKQFQCLGCRDYFYMPRVGNYCPNCGRRLEGTL